MVCCVLDMLMGVFGCLFCCVWLVVECGELE